MEKILFDTDIGSDIDDAWCLTYLLAHPECELVGITTVTGEVQKRCEIADAICKNMGKNIPIHAGIEQPMYVDPKQPIAKQYAKIDNWAHDTNFDNDAVEFMRKTIRENPGEITLLAVGPLTNVATLILLDREIPKLLKQIVIMGGRFMHNISRLPNMEWNIMCDPHAAQIVYSSTFNRARSIGLDVTKQVVMKEEEVREKLTASCLKPAVDFASVWFEVSNNNGKTTFHDPLAGVVVFEEDICKYDRGFPSVELASDVVRGMTHFKWRDEGNWEIAKEVDVDRFFNEYLSKVNSF